MERKVNLYIYWIPRIVSIIFIFFIMMFSLDVFEGNGNFKDTMIAFIMHNIPAVILTFVLIIAWKFEIVGGIVFIGAGLYYLFITLQHPTITPKLAIIWFTTIGLPAITIGVLFLIGWFQKKKIEKNEEIS